MGFISISTDWFIILHLIQQHFIKVIASFNEIQAFSDQFEKKKWV